MAYLSRHARHRVSPPASPKTGSGKHPVGRHAEILRWRRGKLDHPPSRMMTPVMSSAGYPSRHRKVQRLAAARHVYRRKPDRGEAAAAAVALFIDLELAFAGA